jgi:hypothetical protein
MGWEDSNLEQTKIRERRNLYSAVHEHAPRIKAKDHQRRVPPLSYHVFKRGALHTQVYLSSLIFRKRVIPTSG